MRPNAVESLRTIQTALAEHLVPELTSVYALDIVQALTMLVESLANEWDTAAENMRRDNEKLRGLLSLAPGVAGNTLPAAIVKEAAQAIAKPATESVTLSALSAENELLRAALERLLVGLESEASRLGEAGVSLRRDIYAHLREVALRGWSFWDMASFRERMTDIRANIGQMT